VLRPAGRQVELCGHPAAGVVGCGEEVVREPARDSADLIEPAEHLERRLVAVAAGHPLARRDQVAFAEIAAEPYAALPASAGPARDFWLAVADRGGRPARVAAEVSSADEVFELVSAGTAVVLLAEGNAAVYARPGITRIPVTGLEPARLAIAWRRGDRRPSVADFVRACRDAAAGLARAGHDAR
jgi:DNA-binding transcriptional LysR family regulator